MGSEVRVCKKCLLREQAKDVYATIQELLDQMDPALKAPPELYEARLARCVACEKLLSGMCRVCGCFVEVRAAAKAQTCPDPHHYW